MGTLYVVGAPQGHPEDLTLRAIRILRQAALVVAEDAGQARRLLAGLQIATPLVSLVEWAGSCGQELGLQALDGADVALLLPGTTLVPTAASARLISAAAAAGFPVVPIPGPSLPVTALVLSGLPSDSFAYLGWVPHEAASRRALLAAVAAEPRTLVALATGECWPHLLADLGDLLGDRPLVVVAGAQHGGEPVWRGTTGGASELLALGWAPGVSALVVGGARDVAVHWSEEQLRAEVALLAGQGLRPAEIGARLSAGSGWPRRAIYRLAVEASRRAPGT